MSAALRQHVRDRAGARCEYCRFHEEHLPLWSFHLEHIVAEQHGGTDESENLAWSCQRCNLHKGTNLSAMIAMTTKSSIKVKAFLCDWRVLAFIVGMVHGRGMVS